MEQTQTLTLLFARLGLPLPTVRWWTYWEIASLLDGPETADVTWAELLTRLSRAELESEAVELLTPLLLVKRRLGKSATEVRSAVGRPSVLSDHIVSLIYNEAIVVPAWLSAHSGHVPLGFSVTDEERKSWSHRVQIGVLPVLDRIGKRIGISLVEQFEYEMAMLRTRHKALHGSLEYFAGGYYRNKITGPLDEQDDHLWRSAYLRAVAYAVSQIDMPPESALLVCRDLTPLSRWLGKLRPPGFIPTWLPRLEVRADAPEVFMNAFISSLAKSVTDECKGSEILGVLDARLFSTPRTEVEMLAILVLDDSKEVTDIERFFSDPAAFISPEEGSTEAFVLVNSDDQPSRDQACRSLTRKLSLGLDGYLQAEILMRPPWVTIPINPEERVVCRTAERPELLLFTGGRQVGRCFYWNYEWSPVHDTRVGPSACTATIFSKEYVKSLPFSHKTDGKILWCATVLSREDDHLDFSEKKLFGSLPVSL